MNLYQGPYLEGGTPDLRNLRLFYTGANSGDVIIAVSDGVHDNLDPEQLGVPPNKVDESLPYKTWNEVPGKAIIGLFSFKYLSQPVCP